MHVPYTQFIRRLAILSRSAAAVFCQIKRMQTMITKRSAKDSIRLLIYVVYLLQDVHNAMQSNAL